jgi:NAD(P)-dependent dehydrogenase (short-subunit alcohol dehydrogenase family)
VNVVKNRNSFQRRPFSVDQLRSILAVADLEWQSLINPSKRMADPLEIAKLAVYLASDDSAYVVGADFLIDGGVTAISAVGA